MSIYTKELLCILKISWDLFFESDDEDDNGGAPKRKRLDKNQGFWENTVPRFNIQQFKSHFRLSPDTFENLFRNLLEIETRSMEIQCGRPKLNFELQLFMTIWYLANTECFRSIADRFEVSKKACWCAVYNVCKLLLKLNNTKKIITWLRIEGANITESYYHTRYNFPGVIGSIDGSHIPISAPREDPNSYVNRKKFHSVLLQAVCNEKLIFLDCYAGEAGSIHDSCLFRRSNLFKRISNGSVCIPEEQHLLGDQAYGLKSYLMTPYKDNGALSEHKKKYNHTHSSIRMSIERAFGLLKARFRRLRKLETRKPELIPLIIMSCCILHNVCLFENDLLDFDFIAPEGDILPSQDTPDGMAQAKRARIANLLN